MARFETKRLPPVADTVAPDGSDVRVLLGLAGGGLAHFALGPGRTSIAVAHRSVEEIWFFLSGRGEMWRKLGNDAQVVTVDAGVCITIPVHTEFQFRSVGDEALSAVAVTMPPWPGPDEAYTVKGPWTPTVAPAGHAR